MYKCPECGNEDGFVMLQLGSIIVDDEGEAIEGTFYADADDICKEPDDWIMCCECDHDGKVSDFVAK